MHGNERVLHHFLRSAEITDEQRGEPYERAIVGAVQLRHCPVGISADHDCGQGESLRQGFSHVSWTRNYVRWLTRGQSRVLRHCVAGPCFQAASNTPHATSHARARAEDRSLGKEKLVTGKV